MKSPRIPVILNTFFSALIKGGRMSVVVGVGMLEQGEAGVSRGELMERLDGRSGPRLIRGETSDAPPEPALPGE